MIARNMAADNMTALAHSPNVGIRKLNLLGCTALVLAVGGFGGWASTTEIAGAVIATGSVVVESNVKKVQLNGGIVGEILVKEGSVVEPDQLLMRLDDTLTRANLGMVQSQLDLYVAREARLMTERDGLTNIALLHGATADAGGTVTYTVVLSNSGPAGQQDNAGNEFLEVFSARRRRRVPGEFEY